MHLPVRREGYLAVIGAPGALPTFLPAVLGRLAYGTLPLALLLDIHAATGGYGAAGYFLAALGLASLAMPIKARLIDRLDPPAVLAALGVLTAFLLALVPWTVRHTPTPLVVVLGLLVGLAAVPLGPAMRALWTHLVPARLVRTALSLDAVVEEGLYAIGPVLVVLVVATTTPAAAVLGTALLLLIGALGMAWSSRGRWLRAAPADHARWSPGVLRNPPMLCLLLLIVLVATGLGALDLAVPARALEQGSEEASGVLLALLAVGSVIGGLLWGRVTPRIGFGRQFGWVSAALAIGLLGAASLTWLPGFAVVLLVTGMAMSPMFIIAFQFVDRVGAPDRKTEAMSWVNVANNIGAAGGAVLAGTLLDVSGSTRVLLLAGGIVAAAAAAALLASQGRLTHWGHGPAQRAQPHRPR